MQLIQSFRNALPTIKQRADMPVIYTDWDDDTTNYDKARHLFNKRFDYKPAAILMCKETKNVIAAIKLAKDFKLPLRVRSGGHDHEGESSATDCILVNLSEMKGLRFAENDSIAYIQPGWVFKDIVKKLDAKKISISHGTCGTVGVPGFTFGGGWGPWTRLHGMCCDRLIGATIVLGNGEVVQLSEGDSDPAKKDLLWALRGGGGFSYGIVTELVIKTFKQPDVTRKFRVLFEKYPALDILKKWEALIEHSENEALIGTNLKILGIPYDKNVAVEESKNPCTFYGYYAGDTGNVVNFIKDKFADIPEYVLIVEQMFSEEGFVINDMDITFTRIDNTEIKGKNATYKNRMLTIDGEETEIGEKEYLLQNEIFTKEKQQEGENTETELTKKIELLQKNEDYTFGSWDRITQETSVQEMPTLMMNGEMMPGLIPPDADESAPHRITSRMVQEDGLGEEGRKTLINSLRSDMITQESKDAGIFNYVTLGCISGPFYEKYKDNPSLKYNSAFPYHLRPYIIQYQVWWNTEDKYRKAGRLHHVNQLANRAMDWIDINREREFPQTEGSFISFKDASVPTQNYFLQNYERLVAIKKEYSQDEDNLFRSRKTII